MFIKDLNLKKNYYSSVTTRKSSLDNNNSNVLKLSATRVNCSGNNTSHLTTEVVILSSTPRKSSKVRDLNQIDSKVSSSQSQHKINSFKTSQSMSHEHDHDKISLSSLNTVLDDFKKEPERVVQTQSQRRASVLRRWAQHSDIPYVIGAHIAEDNHGLCGKILLGLSWFLIVIFFPLSLFITLKVVQEYEYYFF